MYLLCQFMSIRSLLIQFLSLWLTIAFSHQRVCSYCSSVSIYVWDAYFPITPTIFHINGWLTSQSYKTEKKRHLKSFDSRCCINEIDFNGWGRYIISLKVKIAYFNWYVLLLVLKHFWCNYLYTNRGVNELSRAKY